MSTRIVDLLAAVLRGDPPPDGGVGRVSEAAVLASADEHGVLPLVASCLARMPEAPADLRAELQARAQQGAVADLLQEIELRRVTGALDGAGARYLVMKGAQLAYSHYPRPDLRPRLDTDLFVAQDALPAVHDTLAGLGYRLHRSVGEAMVMSQRCYARRGDGGILHVFDVHWKIANPQLFNGLVSFEELAADSVALPQLGPAARGLSAVHALFVACVHRVAHHPGADALIWLYDIHLVGSRCDLQEWRRFVEMATRRRVAAICRSGLEQTIERFGTPVPVEVLDALAVPGAGTHEATAGYLVPHRTRVAAMMDDMRVLRTWGDRWRLLREHALPGASYMREVYAPASAAPLPILYARRVMRGAWKWFSRT